MLYIAADSTLANFAVESLKQLNSSASAAEPTGDASVVVAAQFSVDAPGGQTVPRYIFRPSNGAPSSRLKSISGTSPKLEETEQEALESFLEWAYENSQSDHYALILWSHGPQLFLQPPPGGKTGDSASLYLTPKDLRTALESKKPPTGRKLDMIGFDACSMSMFEMAYELKDLAKLMIASQEEVPDASFPYSALVRLFRQQGNALGSLLDTLEPKNSDLNKGLPNEATLQSAGEGLKQAVEDYLTTYQDYIVGRNTGMNPVTLSVLNLTHCDGLKDAVRCLACALQKAAGYPELPRRLIQARKNSQDYAGGLYVDLHEFCANLSKQLDGSYKWKNIRDACQKVMDQLTHPSDRLTIPSDSLILMNGAVPKTGEVLINQEGTTSHGISIYLPYLTVQQYAKVNTPLVKGGPGTNGGKGIPNALNSSAVDYLISARQSLILTTENYYGDLKLAADTAWYSFITDQWTKAISETDADPAFHYSGRQIDINLGRKRIDVTHALLVSLEHLPDRQLTGAG